MPISLRRISVWIFLLTVFNSQAWALDFSRCRLLFERAFGSNSAYPISSYTVLNQLIYSNYDQYTGQNYQYLVAHPRSPDAPSYYVRPIGRYETRAESYERLGFSFQIRRAIETLYKSFIETSSLHVPASEQVWIWREKAELLILSGRLDPKDVSKYIELRTALIADKQDTDSLLQKRLRVSTPRWDRYEDLVLTFLNLGYEKYFERQRLTRVLFGNREAAHHVVYTAGFSQQQSKTFSDLFRWMTEEALITLNIQSHNMAFRLNLHDAVNLAFRIVEGGLKPNQIDLLKAAVQSRFTPEIISKLEPSQVFKTVNDLMNQYLKMEAIKILGLVELPSVDIRLDQSAHHAWKPSYR